MCSHATICQFQNLHAREQPSLPRMKSQALTLSIKTIMPRAQSRLEQLSPMKECAVDPAPKLILLDVIHRIRPCFPTPLEIELQDHSLESRQVLQGADDRGGIHAAEEGATLNRQNTILPLNGRAVKLV